MERKNRKLIRRRGRPIGKNSSAAEFVFKEVGDGKRFRTQSELRAAAGVGAGQMDMLRDSPRKLPHLTLVKLGDAVGVDVQRLLKLAGNNVTLDAIRELRREASQLARRNEAEKNILRVPAVEFFRDLGRRGGGKPFLIAAAFSSRPLGAENPEVTTTIANLLWKDDLYLAAFVPAPLEHGDGALVDRYRDIHDAIRGFVRNLVSHRPSDSRQDTLTERLAVFVSNLSASSCRLVPPPLVADERSSLIIFDPAVVSVAQQTDLLACWRNSGEHGDPMVDIIHDPCPPHNFPNNPERIKEWKDFFRCILRPWQDGERNLSKTKGDEVWQRDENAIPS